MEKAELVFVPSPAIGHVVAAIEIAKLLTRRDDRISVTVLVMQFQVDSGYTTQVQSLAASATLSRFPIRFVTLPDVEGSFTPPSDPARFFSDLVCAHAPLVRDAVSQRLSSDSAPPRLAGLVIDMFCTPMIDVADEFRLPSYIFFTSGVAFLGFLLRLQSLHDDEGVDVTEFKDSDAEFDVPSFAHPIPIRVFPSVLLDRKGGGMDVTLFHSRRCREVKGFLVNSFAELESHAVGSFRSGAQVLYPVGPLLGSCAEQPEQDDDDVIMKWLDGQPPASVVFLCFGSRGCFGVDQVKEIARALARGGHRFLWSLRKPPAEGKIEFPSDYENPADVLPEGFLDRTAAIGKVIGWAPQRAILAHPAIGAFVSHCGWNSILESIWCGVPVAAWPMYAEQNLNAFQIVRDLGFAAEIKMGYDSADRSLVTAEEIEKGIRCAMDDNGDVRKKAKEMKEKSREALMEGGSSLSCLGHFIDDIMTKK